MLPRSHNLLIIGRLATVSKQCINWGLQAFADKKGFDAGISFMSPCARSPLLSGQVPILSISREWIENL